MKIKELTKQNIGKNVKLTGEINITEKTSNNGNKYLAVVINDGTEEIYDNIFFDKKEALFNELKPLNNAGRYNIEGTVRSVKEGTNGFYGINISKVELVPGSIKEPRNKKEIAKEFSKLFKSISNKAYRDLINCCYKEVDLDLLYTVPVSENHYVYEGGLSDHIIRTNEIINSIIGSYKGELNFNKDLLTTACLLFRIGKTKTLNWKANNKAELTDIGVLFEDSSITHDIVNKCLEKATGISETEKLCLLHTIDASKYKPEYGALAEPKTKEAYLLYYAEMLSLNEAKFTNLKNKLLDESNNVIFAPGHKVFYMTENLSPKEKEDN